MSLCTLLCALTGKGHPGPPKLGSKKLSQMCWCAEAIKVTFTGTEAPNTTPEEYNPTVKSPLDGCPSCPTPNLLIHVLIAFFFVYWCTHFIEQEEFIPKLFSQEGLSQYFRQCTVDVSPTCIYFCNLLLLVNRFTIYFLPICLGSDALMDACD